MKRLLTGLMLAMLPLFMFGCGSGNSSSGTTVTGAGSKGPISGANVAIFQVTTSAHIGTQLATATTTANGGFSANLGGYTGAIFATMSGSSASYTDEATNTAKTLGTTKLHAVAVITTPGQFNLAITPFTELAYENASALTPAGINASNTNVSNLFLQGTSIISTLPANIQSTAPAVTNPDTINYSLALARFSQVLATGSLTVPAAITQLKSEISGTTLTSPEWTASSTALAANNTFTTNFQSGLLTAPVSIAFSPTTYSAIINKPVTITATVTNYDGTAVPDGTAVTFTASAGTLSSTTATASGNATVVLTPSALGTITVNASAAGGTVTTKTAASVTVVSDPNDPGSVTLTPSSASVQVGQPVTLSATVGVAGGGPNNVTKGSAPNPAATVTFAITGGTGTLSATTATTNGSGVATVTLNSTSANTVTVTATATNAAGTSTPIISTPVQVAFTPNPIAPATVTVSASSASIPADGTTASTITATVTNYAGTALSGVAVSFTTTGGTLGTASAATTDANGKVTIPLTSSTTVGSVTVTASATAAGVTVSGTTPVAFTKVASGTVTVIVGTSGQLSNGIKIGSVEATLGYPTTGLTPTAETASGVAASALSEFNANTVGAVTMGLISTSGFTTGQIATITFNYTGSVPVAGNFTISGASVTDTATNTLSGISVVVQSVTVN